MVDSVPQGITDPVEERDVQKLLVMLSDTRVVVALASVLKNSNIDIQLDLDQLVGSLSAHSDFRTLVGAIVEDAIVEEMNKQQDRNPNSGGSD